MKQFFLLFATLLFSQWTFSQRATETVCLKVDGLDRCYRVYLPKSYAENRNYPLLFVLHGGGGKATGMEKLTRNRFNRLADRDNFIVAYPNGYKKGWNDGARDTLAEARRLNIDDVGFFDAMIRDLQQKLSVNTENVFACGISNGGFMVQRLAIERPAVFKGIAVVAANLSKDQKDRAVSGGEVSVMFICGTNDPLVPYKGGPVTVLKQKRGEVLSVAESIDFWKRQNACTEPAGSDDFPDSDPRDGSTAHKTAWQYPGNAAVKVVDIRIEGGGHTWPGGKQYLPRKLVGNTNRDINACDEIWTFFNTLIQ